MFLPILVKFLVREGEAAGKSLLGGFEVKRPLQFLIANVGAVLIRDMPVDERPERDREREFALIGLGVNHAIRVISTAYACLETEVLDVHVCPARTPIC